MRNTDPSSSVVLQRHHRLRCVSVHFGLSNVPHSRIRRNLVRWLHASFHANPPIMIINGAVVVSLCIRSIAAPAHNFLCVSHLFYALVLNIESARCTTRTSSPTNENNILLFFLSLFRLPLFISSRRNSVATKSEHWNSCNQPPTTQLVSYNRSASHDECREATMQRRRTHYQVNASIVIYFSVLLVTCLVCAFGFVTFTSRTQRCAAKLNRTICCTLIARIMFATQQMKKKRRTLWSVVDARGNFPHSNNNRRSEQAHGKTENSHCGQSEKERDKNAATKRIPISICMQQVFLFFLLLLLFDSKPVYTHSHRLFFFSLK